MPKFRTMYVETPELPTHQLDSPEKYLTKIGRFLRKTSLDEIPQFISVLFGEIGLLVPRPALYNQNFLIEIRTKEGVHKLKPVLTGLAQINGRDRIDDEQKAILDSQYKSNLGFCFDLKIIFFTLLKITKAEDVIH